MKSIAKTKEQAILHFESLGFKKKKHPGWIQMERVNKSTGVTNVIEFNIKGVEGNCFLYSLRSSIYFMELSGFFTPLWNKHLKTKFSKNRVFGIYPKLAQSFQEHKLSDFSIPKAVLSFSDIDMLFEELIVQFENVQTKFFSQYVDLIFIQKNLDQLKDEKWTELFGPDSVFLKLYFKKLESKKAYLEYKTILKGLMKSKIQEYKDIDLKKGAKEIEIKFDAIKNKLSK